MLMPMMQSKFLEAAVQRYWFLKDNQIATETKDHMKKLHDADNGLELDRVLSWIIVHLTC